MMHPDPMRTRAPMVTSIIALIVELVIPVSGPILIRADGERLLMITGPRASSEFFETTEFRTT